MKTAENQLTLATLRRATELAESIETQQAELNSLLAGKLNGSAVRASNPSKPRGAGRKQTIVTKTGQTRTFTAESRAAIARGQEKRWAKYRKEQRQAKNQAAAPASSIAPAPAPVAPAPAPVTTAPPVPQGTPVAAKS